MLVCENCDAEIDDDDEVCPECGNDVSEEENTQEFWTCAACGCESGDHLDQCHECGADRDGADVSESGELLTCAECGTEEPESNGYVNDSGVFRCDICMSSHDE